jgi:hypothetical protein
MAPIKFRGTPLALSAAFAADDVPSEPAMVMLEASSRLRLPPAIQAVPFAPAPILRLHLPRNTPPGTYEGTLRVGAREEPVVVTVDPEVFLRLLPDRLVFEAAPGAHVPFDLTFLNLGNVPVDVRGAYAFGLFDVSGAERAIAKMATAKSVEGHGRVDILADALAEEHGGLVRVKVESGAGALSPGETRDVKVTIHVPDRIRSGQTYWGTWPIHNMRYYVRITGRATPPNARASHE